ncbi:MAG: type II toxin-antitoxin system VapC family toxin [Dehalococcoidia bacterium]|nr:type II toxin-antitoxin system VapC family toxin [Dehalococcoidia bacterium]
MIVCDTHTWLWWAVEDARLSSVALAALDDERDCIGIPAISVWELGMLAAKQRITLTVPVDEFVHRVLARQPVQLLPVSPEIALAGSRLPIHGDPGDRLIAATAIIHDAPLITADAQLQALPFLRTLW